jgi:trimethylguanosine synthase
MGRKKRNLLELVEPVKPAKPVRGDINEEAQGNKEIFTESSAVNIEEEDLLRQFGLPTHFGNVKANNTEKTIIKDDIDECYPPIMDIPIVMEEDDEQAKAKRRRKKGKAPILSEHYVESQTLTVKEVLAYYPNGYIVTKGESNEILDDKEPLEISNKSTGILEPKLHIRFDDEGDPIIAETKQVSIRNPIKTPTNDDGEASSSLKRYQRQRYDFFHRYDEGIQIDHEGWFSVTPENIALSIAQKLYKNHGTALVWDAFTGVGGNAIQFALSGMHVIATEIDIDRISMAKHNASVYGVEEYIDFILGDALRLPRFWRHTERTSRFAAAFLSPPWGGPNYLKESIYNPLEMLPLDCQEMAKAAHETAHEVVYYLPKTTDITKLATILPISGNLAIDLHYLADRLKVVVVNHRLQ